MKREGAERYDGNKVVEESGIKWGRAERGD